MSEHSTRKRARDMLTRSGYSCGGHMARGGDAKEDKAQIDKSIRKAFGEHDNQQHGGKKTRLKLKDGGIASGGMPHARGDRKGRSGKKGKGHTTVNVIVAGQHAQPTPVPVPKPIPVPVNAGGPPPGGGPMPMPPGGPGGPPPMGLKRGGKAKADSARDTIKGMPEGHFKRGGRAKAKFPVPLDAGSGGGKGRLEKAKDYGART